MIVVVHGDDFVIVGDYNDLKHAEHMLAQMFEIKVNIIGNISGCTHEMKVLNRMIAWTREGIRYIPDGKHAEKVIQELGLEEAKGVGKPMADDISSDSSYDYALSMSEARLFRSLAARCNYMAQDRPDLQVAVKGVCKSMSSPSAADWAKLKRIGRYLLTYPEWEYVYRWQSQNEYIDAYSDSDWAGCKVTRKSCSGGCIMRGSHILKTWAKDQSVVALSSGEAEMYAAVRTGTEALGLQALAEDMGVKMKIRMKIDASATLGMINRRGLGKVRHIEVSNLWLQNAVRDNLIEVMKIPSKENIADLMTKSLGNDEIVRYMHMMGFNGMRPRRLQGHRGRGGVQELNIVTQM